MIKLENVSKSYNEKIILDNFSYEFPKSGFVAITGPSGRGKTTLINLILGLKKPNYGSVIVDGVFSVVFQEDCLLPQRSVLFNTLLAAKDSLYSDYTCKGSSLENKAISILEELGLKDELSTPVEKLSGGMARRVAIARSLCLDADIYIMDEPLAGLDETTRFNVLNTIHEYTDKKGKLLIMITHDSESLDNATKIIDLGTK